jgi:hypothetical protein
MRLAVLLISVCLPGAVMAQEATAVALNKTIAMAAVPAPSVDVVTDISISMPLSVANPLELHEEGDAIRRYMSLRAADACAPFLASSAKSCTITAINVTSDLVGDQSQAGMGCGASASNTVMASASITMRIEPR